MYRLKGLVFGSPHKLSLHFFSIFLLLFFGILYFSQYFFAHENTGLFLNLVIALSAGLGLFFVSLVVLKGLVVIDKPFVSSLLLIVLVAMFTWAISITGGVTSTEIGGLSFEPGTVMSIIILGSCFIFGFILFRIGVLPSVFIGMVLLFSVLGFAFESPLLLGNENVSVRPSTNATVHTMLSAYYENKRAVFFGTGPQSFPFVWSKNKPSIVNSTSLWNEDFESGSSLAFTLMTTHGAVFALFLILSLALLFGRLLESVFTNGGSHKGHSSLALVLLIFFSVFFVFAATSNPGIPLLSTAALFAGFSTALTSLSTRKYSHRLLRYTVSTFLFFVGIFILIFVGFRTYSLIQYDSALSEINKESANLTRANDYLERSLVRQDIPEVMRLLTSSYLKEGESIVNNAHGSLSEMERSRLAEVSEKVINLSGKLTDEEPDNYRNWILSGDAQLFVWALGRDTKSLENSLENYKNAQGASGGAHPLPFFLVAQVLVIQGEAEDAKLNLEKALALKNDYEEAGQLLSLIDE